MQAFNSGDRTAPDFRALFEASPTRQLALTPEGLTVVAASDAFLRATMTRKEDVVGHPLFDLLGFEDHPAQDLVRVLRSSLDRMLTTRAPDAVLAQPYDVRRRAPEPGAGSRWMAVHSPVLDEEGRVALIIHTLEEVSEVGPIRQELAGALAARDEALRTSQLKTRFLGMVSHELRTPLTALSLQVERMQRNAADLDHRHQESLDRIAYSASRLREMIETLLEYARIDGGHVSVNDARFDLAESVRKTVANHRHDAEQRALELRCLARVTPVVVQSDQRLVELVISNLLDNAIKFTPTGTVSVALDRSADGAHHVAVTDSGPGIPEPHQRQIFEPFEQLGSAGPSRSGIGLGLALVRDIAAALGGRIELVSKPNEGSTFTFVLPGDAATEGAAASPEPGTE